MSFLDDLLGNKINKEAEILQGKDAADHFDRKVQAHPWVESILELDPVQVEAEYQKKLADEAMTLGKTAAYEMGETPKETIEKDYKRDVSILSDYALAEMLAELRCNKEQNTNEMFYEAKEKAKKDVASSREKAEKALLDLVPEHTALDWQKAFERFSKEAKPEQPKEKDLYEPKAPEASHEFEKPTEDKFKVPSEEKKADVMIGVGREEKDRTEATKEAGVLQESITEGLGKVASQSKKADYEGWSNHPTWAVALWLDNDQGLYNAVREASSTIPDQGQFAEWLKTFTEEQQPELGSSLWDDLLNSAMADVNWYEIAGHEMEKEASKLPKVEKKADAYQPKTGESCSCRPGVSRDNCPSCEGTGSKIDFKKIHEKKSDMGCECGKEPKSPLMREELPVEASARCPLCGNAGRDVGNNQKDNLSCKDCGIMYEGKEPMIQSHASKDEVIKIMKKAEISSPWIVTTDSEGNDVIARRDMTQTNEKVSEEDKEDELKK